MHFLHECPPFFQGTSCGAYRDTCRWM